jgi:hypothetical protein
MPALHPNAERTTALVGWLHRYDQHRAHTALGGQPPITRVNTLPTPTARRRLRLRNRPGLRGQVPSGPRHYLVSTTTADGNH